MTNFEIPRVLTPRIAAAVGVTVARTRTELRRGNWHSMARGAVLTRPDDPTRGDWAALGIAVGGPSAALSGWDALRMRGLGPTSAPCDEVLVVSRHTSSRVIGKVRISETTRPYRKSITSADAGLNPLTPVVAVARAAVDASGYFDALTPVRALVTTAVQRKLCSVEDLMSELRAAPRADSRLFRAALSDVVDGARSVAEARASERMSREPIPPFELNVPILDAAGRVIAIADVLWRALRAVLEIDSREFHFSEAAWKRTMERHNRLTRRGLAVTHYPPSQVMARHRDWLCEVQAWLRERARELGVALPRGRGVIRPASDGVVPFRA